MASKGHFLWVGLANRISQSHSPTQATHLGLTVSHSHINSKKCLTHEGASNQTTYATDINIIKEIKGDVKISTIRGHRKKFEPQMGFEPTLACVQTSPISFVARGKGTSA